VQCGIKGYPEDVAIANLITAKNDTILVPINMNTKQFLKAYVKAHGIQVFPKPTIDNSIADMIDEVNGAPPIDTAANVDANQEENGKAAPPQDQAEGVDDRNQDDKEVCEVQRTRSRRQQQRYRARQQKEEAKAALHLI
jgi:hypothetical protein